MMQVLYNEILNSAMRVNVYDNSELAIGRFQGMVEAYKLLGGEFYYTIEKGIIFTMGNDTVYYIWNSWNLGFDFRVR